MQQQATAASSTTSSSIAEKNIPVRGVHTNTRKIFSGSLAHFVAAASDVQLNSPHTKLRTRLLYASVLFLVGLIIFTDFRHTHPRQVRVVNVSNEFKQNNRALSSKDRNSNSTKRIHAVCITGQVTRMLPEHLVRSLVHGNPDENFVLFYTLQNSTRIFNTLDDITKYQPTRYKFLEYELLEQSLLELVNSEPNGQLSSVQVLQPHARRYWQRYMGHQHLDRFEQYVDTQHSILNMYNNQVHCVHRVLEHEERHNVTFDTLISTREDVFFFRPPDMKRLFSPLGPNGTCDVIAKRCLAWGGVNMRFQLMSRNAGVELLRSRLQFYGSLYRSNIKFWNPERFEKKQAEELRLRTCPLPITDVPVIAARHTKEGNFCFLHIELFNDWNRSEESCIPDYATQFVDEHKCESISTR